LWNGYTGTNPPLRADAELYISVNSVSSIDKADGVSCTKEQTASKLGMTAYEIVPTEAKRQTCVAAALYEYNISMEIDWGRLSYHHPFFILILQILLYVF
jgi:hypothetical protein